MAPDELAQLFNRRPYIPLRVHVAETTSYDVQNPNLAMVGRSILFLGLRRDIDSPLFDEPVMIALQHITRVEPILEPQKVN